MTLTGAVRRLEELRETEAIGEEPLTAAEALELLALMDIVARKAGYGRQLTVRSARAAGASWADIGAAMGITRQAAWELHHRWLDNQDEPVSDQAART